LIDPTFSVVEEAREYAQARKLGLPHPAQLREEVLEDVHELLPTLRKIRGGSIASLARSTAASCRCGSARSPTRATPSSSPG
jgi:hypothetical protein